MTTKQHCRAVAAPARPSPALTLNEPDGPLTRKRPSYYTSSSAAADDDGDSSTPELAERATVSFLISFVFCIFFFQHWAREQRARYGKVKVLANVLPKTNNDGHTTAVHFPRRASARQQQQQQTRRIRVGHSWVFFFLFLLDDLLRTEGLNVRSRGTRPSKALRWLEK